MIINHYNKYNSFGIVTRRSLRWVPWRSTSQLFFNVTLYTLIHFWLGTQKSNTNLIHLFFMNIKYDELLSEIGNVLQNKRPMGHIAHQSKQFKSINTYDYIITLIKWRKKNFINFIGFSFEKRNQNHESPLPKYALCQDCLKLAQWFWRRGFFFKFRQCIFAISKLSPLGKGWGPSFEQTWIPFTPGCFVPILVEIG